LLTITLNFLFVILPRKRCKDNKNYLQIINKISDLLKL
jgi:hypothetical protein